MGWASFAINELSKGQTVKIRPRGNSMTGRINDGDLVTLQPCDVANLKVGDAVLVRVHGNVLLHLIKAINGNRYLIGNNRGGINGWVGGNAIYGMVTNVERK